MGQNASIHRPNRSEGIVVAEVDEVITDLDADSTNEWESPAPKESRVTFASQLKKLVDEYSEYSEGTDGFRQIQDVAAEILYSRPSKIRIITDTTSLGDVLRRYFWLSLVTAGAAGAVLVVLLMFLYLMFHPDHPRLSAREVTLSMIFTLPIFLLIILPAFGLFSTLAFFSTLGLFCLLRLIYDSSRERSVGSTDTNSVENKLDKSPPRNSPRKTVQLTWKCICQDTRTAVVPHHFAHRLVEIRQQTLSMSPSSTPTAPTTGSSFHTSTTSSALEGNPWPQVLHPSREVISFSEDTAELAYHYPSIANARPFAMSVPMGSRFIHFMVNTGGLRLHEIDAYSMSNDQLFDRMRFAYRQSKGWFRTWFGLWIFSHCDFCKFESWTLERYCERDGGIPPVSEAGYFYLPRPMDNEPPISKHEFYDRFYQRIPSDQDTAARGWLCSGHDAVDRIPQRKGIKMIPTNGRLQFWGIVAREKKSGRRMVAYIILSSVPGFIFFFLWLFALDKDSLQDASTLLMISFTLLGILYATQLL